MFNERYQIFCNIFGTDSIKVYREFIDDMKIQYLQKTRGLSRHEAFYGRVFDHKAFTTFIKENANQFIWPEHHKK